MKKKYVLIDLFIILLLGLIPLLWLHGNQVILGHDAGLSFDPIVQFSDRYYVWSQRFGIGTDQSYALLGAFFIHGIEAFLTLIGFSLQLQQIVQFVFWFTLPGIAMYFFVHNTWSEKRFMEIIAPIIYMVNYYLIQGWFIAERTKFSIYVAFPFVIYFLIRYLTGKSRFLPSVILAGLILGIFNGGGSFPLYGGLIVAIVISYLYINAIYHNIQTLKRTIAFSLGVLCIYVLLNSYWLITYLFYVLSFYSRDLANAGGAEGVLSWVSYLSKGSSFLNLFRGQGVPEWYLNDFHPYASIFLTNPFFIAFSYIFPLLAFLPLVIVNRAKDRFYIYLLVFMILFGIFLSAGTNSQLGVLFVAAIKFVPGFAMFRSAYYKFAYLIWFSYAILIGFSLDYLFTKIQKKIPKLFNFSTTYIFIFVFIVAYLFYHFPILTGSFFDYSNNPNGKLSTRITVPSYIFDFGKWVNAQDQSKRYLVLPELNDNPYISYKWGYWSLAPINSLLVRSSFVQNTALMPSSEQLLLKQMYDSLLRGDMSSFLDFADVFAIDKIVLQKDFDWNNSQWGTTNPEKYGQILKDNPKNFQLEKRFGKWEVYKIIGREKSLRITTSNSLNFLQGELVNIVSLPYFNPKVPLYIGSTDFSKNKSYAQAATNIFLGSTCIQCDLRSEDTGFTVYNPKLLPGSPLYFLITKGENKVNKESTDFSSRVNFLLTTSDRRSVEAKWMVEFRQNLSHLQETLEKNRNTLSLLYDELNKPKWKMEADRENSLIQLVIGHLRIEGDLISSIHNDGIMTLENRLTAASSYDLISQIDQMMRERGWITQDAREKKYIYKIPVGGTYEVLVKRSTLANPKKDISQTGVFIKELNSNLKPVSQAKDWISYGNTNITESAIHLSFTDATIENQIASVLPIMPATHSGILKDLDSYIFTGDSENKCFGFPAHNIEYGKNTRYIASFNYRNFTDRRVLSFSIDPAYREGPSLRSKEALLPERQRWSTFTTSFSPDRSDISLNFCYGFTPISSIRTVGPWLDFLATNHGSVNPIDMGSQSLDEKVVEVRDIALYKLSEPNIALYKKQAINDQTFAPVDFTKKSQVEYDVRLPQSNRPTFLTLRESYGKYWKVCENNGKCLPFSDDVHFADAGFANTWYFANGINSKLSLYYYPQLMYTVGAFISIISLGSISIWILAYFKRKTKL